MRNRKQLFYVLSAVMLYFIGLLIGFKTILDIPKQRHMAALSYETATILDAYKSGSTLDFDYPTNNLSVGFTAIFSPSGEMLASSDGKNAHPPQLDYEEYLSPLVSKAITSDEFCRIRIIYNESALVQSESHNLPFLSNFNLMAIVADTVVIDGGAEAVLFLARDFNDTLAYLIIFLCVYTFVLLIVYSVVFIEYQRAKRMEYLRRNYIDNVTHSLKSPLTSIKALLISLNDYEFSQEQQSRYYGIMLSEVKRLEGMIQNTLTLSRLQNNQTNLKKQHISADILFQPIIKKMADVCNSMDVKFSFDGRLEQCPKLYTYPEYISQILDIFLENALRYIGDDGWICLALEVFPHNITICFSDNGIGIEKDILPHIFERFYRGNNSDLAGGSGLGLAIAKEMANSLDEKIWASSEPGEGASFYLTVSTRP